MRPLRDILISSFTVRGSQRQDLHITHTYVVFGVPYQYTIFWCCLHLLINPGILCHTNVSNDGQSCQNIPSTHMISIHPIEGLRDTMILQCPFIPGMSSSCLINNLCLASSCKHSDISECAPIIVIIMSWESTKRVSQ